jgi:hypothetical protein
MVADADRLGGNVTTADDSRITPVGADAASRRLSMIVAQKPTQSIAAPHRPLALPIVCPRKQQDVTLPLMHSGSECAQAA